MIHKYERVPYQDGFTEISLDPITIPSEVKDSGSTTPGTMERITHIAQLALSFLGQKFSEFVSLFQGYFSNRVVAPSEVIDLQAPPTFVRHEEFVVDKTIGYARQRVQQGAPITQSPGLVHSETDKLVLLFHVELDEFTRLHQHNLQHPDHPADLSMHADKLMKISYTITRLALDGSSAPSQYDDLGFSTFRALLEKTDLYFPKGLPSAYHDWEALHHDLMNRIEP